MKMNLFIFDSKNIVSLLFLTVNLPFVHHMQHMRRNLGSLQSNYNDTSLPIHYDDFSYSLMNF